MNLRPFLIRDIKPKRDYGLKNTLNSERTEKGDEEKKDSSTQVKKARREKEFSTTQ